MADILSILSSGYASQTPTTSSKYVNVDPAKYEGIWSGAYSDNSKFTVVVSQVSGFRAQVKYASGTTVKYQQVLIKDDSFKIGDSKFMLNPNKPDKATIKTVVTNPVTGGTVLNSAPATRS